MSTSLPSDICIAVRRSESDYIVWTTVDFEQNVEVELMCEHGDKVEAAYSATVARLTG